MLDSLSWNFFGGGLIRPPRFCDADHAIFSVKKNSDMEITGWSVDRFFRHTLFPSFSLKASASLRKTPMLHQGSEDFTFSA